MSAEAHMRFEAFSFGSIQIDGITYDHDIVLGRGEVHKRKKKPSKKFHDNFGHTPLSAKERIPWKCRRLVIGTGTGALPVMDEVKQEARRRKVELRILPTSQAIELLNAARADTNGDLLSRCAAPRAGKVKGGLALWVGGGSCAAYALQERRSSQDRCSYSDQSAIRPERLK
jgi:hypothetical protein